MYTIIYLARTAFDDNVTVLTDSTGLLREGFGGTSVGLGLEVMLLVRHGFLFLSLGFSQHLFPLKSTEHGERERLMKKTVFIYDHPIATRVS